MAKQTIGIGTNPNDGSGDPLRTAGTKVNDNFSEIYSALGNGATLLSGDVNFGSNNIKYQSKYLNVSALPSASAYGGMTAKVDSDNKLYFSDGTSWVKLSSGAEAFDGNYNNLTNKPSLFTGNYNDLTNKPTVPTSIGDLVADGSAGQVLTTNGAGLFTFSAINFPNQNLYQSVAGDSGSGSASTPTDTLTIAGGTNITTQMVGSTLTVNSSVTALSQLTNDLTLFDGEITGSIFGDDSTLLVDGINNKIVGPVLSSDLRSSTSNVAIGKEAGLTNQGTYGIAIGERAGNLNQSADGIAIGYAAGRDDQQTDGIAIGQNAGQVNQGASSVAIGTMVGKTDQHANTIMISATGTEYNSTQSDSFFVKPIRNASGTHGLEYNPTTGEVTYDTAGGGGSTAADDITVGDAAVNIATTSGEVKLETQGFNTDIVFSGNISTISGQSDLLRLDTSDYGWAKFGSGISTGSSIKIRPDQGLSGYTTGELEIWKDGAKIELGASLEIDITHVLDTGIVLTNSGTGTPAVELQFVDANEAIGSDGTNLLLRSGNTTFKMPTSDGSAGEVLKTDGNGVLSFTSAGGGGLANVVDDTTPELGGDLVTGNNRITFADTGTVSFMDFTVTQFGENNHTVLSSVKSINLFLDANGGDTGEAFRIYNNTNPDSSPTENTYIFKVSENGDTNITGKLLLPDGSVSANYAGFGDQDDLKIFHNGNHSIVRETGTGNLYLQSNDNVILSKDSDTALMVKAVADGEVELYHNAVKKFETTTDGATVTGMFTSDGLTCGVQNITGPGAIDLTHTVTLLTTTGTDAYTLANGTEGQIKIISMKVNGGNATVTPTSFVNGTSILFNNVEDTITLLYQSTGWVLLARQNATVT